MWPREGEYTLRESDILDLITRQGPSIALVILSGVQYYTGQWFPMKAITNAAKAQVNGPTLFLDYVYFHHLSPCHDVKEQTTIRYIHLPRISLPLSTKHVLTSIFEGVYLRLGPRTCYWECSYVASRLGRRFRCMVLIQISQLGSGRCWRAFHS